MKRHASAVWKKGIMDGQGGISTESGTLSDTQYSFKTRFEQGNGTNPEELVAAAHAGCFAMALSAQLEKEGLKAEVINAKATVTLEKTADGFSIPSIHLEVKAKVPQATQQTFDKAAKAAKEGCPISKLMRAEITMDATLEK